MKEGINGREKFWTSVGPYEVQEVQYTTNRDYPYMYLLELFARIYRMDDFVSISQ